jgi:pyruvate dehydrogenase E2 component (dihydrolipoamide acetyltransferase)
MALVEVQVPDIGDFDEVTVIELMVKVGDTVKAEQSLITVESDKASMEIPSSTAGVVKEMRVAWVTRSSKALWCWWWKLLVRLQPQLPPVQPHQPLRPAAAPVAVAAPLLHLAPCKCMCLTLATSKTWSSSKSWSSPATPSRLSNR